MEYFFVIGVIVILIVLGGTSDADPVTLERYKTVEEIAEAETELEEMLFKDSIDTVKCIKALLAQCPSCRFIYEYNGKHNLLSAVDRSAVVSYNTPEEILAYLQGIVNHGR